MIFEREYHACAVYNNEIFVIGGESGTESFLEIWNGVQWDYFRTNTGGTYSKLLVQNNNLYLYQGFPNVNEQNEIWRMDQKHKKFVHQGYFAESKNLPIVFTITHEFLTNCEGNKLLSLNVLINVSFD